MIRTIVLDDHEMVRGATAARLNAEPDIVVVGLGGLETLTDPRIVRERPDVVVADISFVASCRRILDSGMAIRTLLFSAAEREQAIVTAILIGAIGRIPKHADGRPLVEAVRQAALHSMLNANLCQDVFRRLRDRDREEALSNRDHRLLALASRGLTDKQIARETRVEEEAASAQITALAWKLYQHYQRVDHRAGSVRRGSDGWPSEFTRTDAMADRPGSS